MSRSARLRAPEALWRPTLALATTAAALALSPAAALADTAVEAEAMTLSSSGAGGILTDASGGKALKLWSNGSASKSVAVPQSSVKLTARARGQQCSGAPRLTVSVNGTQRLSVSVSSTSYATHTATFNLPAGTHSVKAALTECVPAGRLKVALWVAYEVLETDTARRCVPLTDTVSFGAPLHC